MQRLFRPRQVLFTHAITKKLLIAILNAYMAIRNPTLNWKALNLIKIWSLSFKTISDTTNISILKSNN